jgi:hypothetical protein
VSGKGAASHESFPSFVKALGETALCETAFSVLMKVESSSVITGRVEHIDTIQYPPIDKMRGTDAYGLVLFCEALTTVKC